MGDQVDGFLGGARAEDLAPSLLSDGGELELRIAWVHAVDLVLSRCTEYLDNFNKLVNTRLSWEEGLTDEKFGDDAAHGPDIDGRGVVSRSKDELGSPIVA